MLGDRNHPRRVFLSHTTELSRFPEGRSFVSAAVSAVNRAGHLPVGMAHFTASATPPSTTCRDAVLTCDVYVLIAGYRYGSVVADEPGRSYTELEHDTAQQAGIKRLVFVLGERTTGPAEMFCDGEHCGRQGEFRARLRTSGVTLATVHSPEELELALFQALKATPAEKLTRHGLNSIPAGPIDFIGRGEVLDRIAAGLAGGGRIVAVTGMSGIGKTSTVIRYAHRHHAEFDIAWWIRAGDPESVPAGLADLARALDLTNARESDQVGVARLRNHLSSRDRWLLVFDDVVDSRALTPYPPCGPGQVLITSRDSVWHGVASATVDMPVLDRSESIAILRSWIPGIGAADADLVADAVGDLPQVIDQAGSRLTTGGLAVTEYLRALEECAVTVYSHDPGGHSLPVAATWALSFDRLADDDPAAMDLLSFLAWCGRGAVPRDVLTTHPDHPAVLPARLASVLADPLTLAEKIGFLRRRGMIVSASPVVMHRVPADLLKARSRTPDVGAEPWPAVVVRALRAVLPADVWDNPPRWSIWRELLPHVRAATAPGRDTDVVRADVAWLLDRMATYLQTTGNPRAALPLFRRALEAGRSEFGNDHRVTLFYANNLAHDLRELGLHPEAFALNQDTLERRRRAFGDDDEDTLKSAKNLALNLFDLGEFERARRLDADTLTRRRHLLGADHEDTLNSARNLANDLRELGEHLQARALHEDTWHDHIRTLGNAHPRTLRCASDLADDLDGAGEHVRAKELHGDTLAHRRRVLGDDHPHTLASAHNLAKTLIALGAHTRARDLLDDTLRSRVQVLGDDHPDTAATRHLLGAVGEALRARDATAVLRGSPSP